MFDRYSLWQQERKNETDHWVPLIIDELKKLGIGDNIGLLRLLNYVKNNNRAAISNHHKYSSEMLVELWGGLKLLLKIPKLSKKEAIENCNLLFEHPMSAISLAMGIVTLSQNGLNTTTNKNLLVIQDETHDNHSIHAKHGEKAPILSKGFKLLRDMDLGDAANYTKLNRCEKYIAPICEILVLLKNANVSITQAEFNKLEKLKKSSKKILTELKNSVEVNRDIFLAIIASKEKKPLFRTSSKSVGKLEAFLQELALTSEVENPGATLDGTPKAGMR